ncbi:hypothetical protein [Parvibaculum sp.]|uniref:hypothetical protein n=1 Tax=Parvibaculum sp. TaxID=2024848 RepID=UPI003BA9A881
MLRVVVALACAIAVIAPSDGFAGAPKCRADDPAAAADADAVQAVRQQISAGCDCASFPADGKKSKHGEYVKCAQGVVKAAVDGKQLRAQCKQLALYPFALSTCGYPAAPPRVPCLKTTKKGPTCKIGKCTGPRDLPCPARDDCLAAADTNHDAQVSALDSGQCNVLDCAAVATLSTDFVAARVDSCFRGCDIILFDQCVTGCITGYDAAFHRAAEIRDLCEADPTVTCDALHAAAAEFCATPPPVPPKCAEECAGLAFCEGKCQLAADCTAIADEINRICLTTNY